MAKQQDNSVACAALSYLFPIGLIWYLVDENMKKNNFVQFHVRQSLAAFVVVFAAWIVVSVLAVISLGFLWYLSFIVWIAGLMWFIQGLVYSLSGKKEKLIFIGDLGEKFQI